MMTSRFPKILLGSVVFASLASAGASAQEVSIYGPVDTQEDVQPLVVVPSEATGIPPRLEQGAVDALSTYPSLRSARASIEAADIDVNAAKWLWGPSVNVSALTRDIRGISPEITVVQPVYTFGKIESSIDRAKAVKMVEIARVGEIAQDILLRLAQNYYEIVRTTQLEGALEESLAEHQRLVDSIQRRVDRDVSPASDLELAKSRLAQVRQQLAFNTAQRYAAQERFRELTGDDAAPGPPFEPYDPAVHHPDYQQAIDSALLCNPTIERIAAEAAVADADKRIAKASIYPELGVQYRYDEFRGSQLGLAVTASTTSGLSPLIAADAARARADASFIDITVAQRQTREQLILDLVENQAARSRIESSAAAADASENVTDSYLRQFIAGRRTWLDVMNAVREAINARIGLTESEVSAMSSAARIRIRTCEWRPYLALTEIEE
ncbi:TolC family protein [Sphingomicrobium sp. XHP0235]|uniref:TolC family protein n=1 Tax=Sphingomicrobium aquimarinum TaxID=3133971 RepID=UPI0031FEA42E